MFYNFRLQIARTLYVTVNCYYKAPLVHFRHYDDEGEIPSTRGITMNLYEYQKVRDMLVPKPSKATIEYGKITCKTTTEGGLLLTRKLFDGELRPFELTNDEVKQIMLK